MRQTGPGRWLARCSAHDDRHPSLAIRVTAEGVVLIHCFGGCGAADVLDAVGLDYADLYPPRDLDPMRAGKPIRRPCAAIDIVRAIGHESLIVAIAAADLAQGKPLSDTDRDRLLIASERIRNAAAESGHGR